ncbi:hypothetical protein FQN50_004803 [Emmonsiellopsis sp. PD_5]|nr:hypothetical protein FQN50_004803 [Emmonsiellopsis sp. PD_5]
MYFSKGIFSHLISLFFCFVILLHFSSCQDDQAPLQPAPTADSLAGPVSTPLPPQPKQIAVVGAGAAGTSTAYFLRQYADFFSIPLNITVYERDSHVGGRSTTVNLFDDPAHPIELGASIFVKANKNLIKASKKFGLKLRSADHGQPKESTHNMAIWDGRQFVYLQQSGGFYWWSVVKLLYRYGWAPMKTQNLMKETVNKFLKLYKWPYFPWKSLSEVTMSAGLAEATWASGAEYLKDNGVSEKFAREIVQAGTRVNYGQNLALIHGLETMVCMATDGAVSVEGGNWQIFHSMLNASRATVNLNTPVTDINLQGDQTYKVIHRALDNTSVETHFDHVVLANPYQFSNISLSPAPNHLPEKLRYVNLHVTLFASPHKLSPSYFKMPPKSPVPEVVLTTLPADVKLGAQLDGVGPAQFWSISTLQKVKAAEPSRQGIAAGHHYVYKIFSPTKLNASFLANLLGVDEADFADGEPKYTSSQTIADISKTHISWCHEKVWNSYPYLYPRVTFEDIKMGPGLWYTSGIESFISTMETSSLSGMNVAALILAEWISQFETKLKTYGDGAGF